MAKTKKAGDCENELKVLIAQREYVFNALQTLYDLSKAVELHKTKLPEFKSRFKDAEKLKDKFYDLNSKIDLLLLEAEPTAEVDIQKLISFDELYYIVMSAGDEILGQQQQETCSQSQAVNKNNGIRLPKIQIPKFDGKIENWQVFIDSYDELIHKNSSLSAIEKFHYLISCLSGPALSIAKGVPLTADNYAIVFKALNDRYQNKRVLATNYLDKISKFPKMLSSSLDNLSTFTNTLYENVNALRSLSLPSYDDFILFYLAVQSLDPETREQFELQNTKDLPTIDDLLKYLQNRVKILEVSRPSLATSGSQSQPRAKIESPAKVKVNTKRSFVISSKRPSYNCPCCNLPHSVYKCLKLQKLDVASRRSLVAELNLCQNCLRPSHETNACASNTACLLCGERHNTLLHVDSQRSNSTQATPKPGACSAPKPGSVSKPDTTSSSLAATATEKMPASGNSTIKILGSAVIRIRAVDGSEQLARALIDSCSQDCFMTSACARRLDLPISRCNMAIAGLGQNYVQNIKGFTTTTIKPRGNETPSFNLPFVVLQKITTKMPAVPIPESVKEQFSHLDLADESYGNPSNIDLLLGVEIFDQIYTGQRYVPGPGLPTALSSIYGWILTGQFKPDESEFPQTTGASLFVSSCDLDTLVKQFWETEEPPQKRFLAPEDLECEEMYKKLTYRQPDGRYVVPLLIKENATDELGDSSAQGLSRFLNIERRLNREPELKKEYAKFMSEYEDLGHMQPAPSAIDGSYIIPHHCVVRPDAVSTRLRVVFDASARTSNNKSLNDIVYKGPKLLNDIVDLITKFRLHQVVFTADIAKMYRQFVIRPEDRRFQHILWRESPNQPLTEYELNTVTYGVSSSPYLAIRTLRQLAEDHAQDHPRSAKVLCEDTFMDDVTTGCATLDDAKELRDDLVSLLQRGKMDLRKWSSNDPDFLADLPPEHCQMSKTFAEDKTAISMKILGVKWDPLTDSFSYKTSEINPETTKRAILSMVARIFDPLGWVAPVIVVAKLLLQEMWRQKISWDEPVPPHISTLWQNMVANFTDFEKIQLPRLVLPRKLTACYLVGFCDGSAKAYGCCVYLCAHSEEGCSTNLLIGKSKVAPMPTPTVNRLELLAAVLLARVLNHMQNLLSEKLPIDGVFAFSDSTTVLSWLNTAPHNLQMFVANRVVQTTGLIRAESWNYVPTKENPADCCSRGITCSELANHYLWWQGPEWLTSPPSEWPKRPTLLTLKEIPEIKASALLDFSQQQADHDVAINSSLVTTTEEPSLDYFEQFTKRFSSYNKLRRTFAWVLRFIKNSKPNSEKQQTTFLTASELNESEIKIIKLTQNNYFAKEIALIESQKPCIKSIQKLSPFLDQVGLLRVGGRIRNANLTENKLHPFLLPKKCHLSTLIVDYLHRAYLHCGPRTLQSLIVRKFWIIGLRLLIRSRISKCVNCFKTRPTSCQPIMADLPLLRVQPNKCFSNVGIDFGGPFQLKESKRRNARLYKAYLCVFVCLSTKAIHIEAVTELSTEAFLAALDRFVSRRGLCKLILSDCGTNFVGASRLLKQLFQLDTQDGLASRGIEWQFNPANAPHFGGIFESGIKSAKSHLKRVIGNQTLTLEEFITVLSKIEAMLNSRPLCMLSSDPTECDVLTAGHFLVGDALVAVPEQSLDNMSLHPRSRWQMLHRLTQTFWRVWQRDYLHTLQQKTKWYSDGCHKIKIGDVVIIKDSNLTPLKWKMGRVMTVHPGKDGVVRVVSLKTSTGTLSRPVVKICPLPITEA